MAFKLFCLNQTEVLIHMLTLFCIIELALHKCENSFNMTLAGVPFTDVAASQSLRKHGAVFP